MTMLCCCSVSQLYLTLCDPMNCSMPCFPCPSPSPGVCSNSCPLSQWCWLWPSGGQSIGASASASVLWMNFQGRFPLGNWLVWSPFCPRNSQESSCPVPQFKSINSSALSLLYGPALTPVHDYWKNHSFDDMDLCWQSDISVFNMLSRFVIGFLPRSKHLF